MKASLTLRFSAGTVGENRNVKEAFTARQQSGFKNLLIGDLQGFDDPKLGVLQEYLHVYIQELGIVVIWVLIEFRKGHSITHCNTSCISRTAHNCRLNSAQVRLCVTGNNSIKSLHPRHLLLEAFTTASTVVGLWCTSIYVYLPYCQFHCDACSILLVWSSFLFIFHWNNQSSLPVTESAETADKLLWSPAFEGVVEGIAGGTEDDAGTSIADAGAGKPEASSLFSFWASCFCKIASLQVRVMWDLRGIYSQRRAYDDYIEAHALWHKSKLSYVSVYITVSL